MELLIAFIFLVFISTIFFVWFFIHRARSRERNLLIEKGVETDKLPQIGNFRIKLRFPWLKLGIVIVSTVLGLLLGIFIYSINESYTPGIFMVLFAGVGMILAHYADKSKMQS